MNHFAPEKPQSDVPLPGPHPDSRPPRVLVVEDELYVRRSLARMLAPHYDVSQAGNMTEAMQLIKEQAPDAVVTDLRMPDGDGVELIEASRNDPATPAPPMLVLSAYGEPHERLRALRNGAFDFVVKPFDAPELMARIQRAVGFGIELKRYHRLQLTDELTGLFNRRGLVLLLNQALQTSAALEQPVSLALLDQDGLKQINDSFGHLTGDAALRALASALTESCRASDTIARIGGDEFVIVMANTGADAARTVLRRITDLLSQRTLGLGDCLTVQLSVSYGIATCLRTCDSEALLAAADSELYKMKHHKQQR